MPSWPMIEYQAESWYPILMPHDYYTVAKSIAHFLMINNFIIIIYRVDRIESIAYILILPLLA